MLVNAGYCKCCRGPIRFLTWTTTEQERKASPTANGIHWTYGYGWGDGCAEMPMVILMTILAEDTDEA